MKKDINYYLRDFGALAKSQIAAARDAGFSADEIKNKRQNWYDVNKSHFSFEKNGKGPMTQKQLAFLKSNVPDWNEEQLEGLTFSYARKIIRELAKEAGTESQYIAFIEAQEAHDARRRDRKQTIDRGIIRSGRLIDFEEAFTIASVSSPADAFTANFKRFELLSASEVYEEE